MTPGRRRCCRGDQRGQASVELAVLLPVVVALLLLVVQVGLLVRDRVVVVHAARSAGRAVVISPDAGAARSALAAQGGNVARATVRVGGGRRPGDLATVRVSMRPTRVPVVGHLVAGTTLVEEVTVYVEGSG